MVGSWKPQSREVTLQCCLVLVMLLRLRQICSHSILIAEDGVYMIEDEGNDSDDADHVKLAMRQEGAEFVNKLKSKLKTKALALMEAEKSQVSILPIMYGKKTDNRRMRTRMSKMTIAPSALTTSGMRW